MLDDREYAEVFELYSRCMREIKERRDEEEVALAKTSVHERFKAVRDAYERISGWKDMHHNAIMHHQLSALGPACPRCGKPLRTPRAKLCAECGWNRRI